MRVINLQKSNIVRQNSLKTKNLNYSDTIKDDFNHKSKSNITFKGPNQEYIQTAYFNLIKYSNTFNANTLNIAQKSINLFKALLRAENSIDINAITSHFKNKLKIDVDFSGDKILAAYSALTTNIYQKLGLVLPSAIYTGDVTKLCTPKNLNFIDLGCCYPFIDNSTNQLLQNVLKKNIIFKPRTVVFSSSYDWKKSVVDSMSATAFKHRSTPHFLETQMHKFAHSAHFDNIFKRYGYPYPNSLGYKDGNCNQTLNNLGIAYDNLLHNKVADEMSIYGGTDRMETVADQLSYKIAESLDKEFPKKAPSITKSLSFELQRLIINAWEGYL